MATIGVKREDGVLKLVYLGWLVELYWEPITAREVMEKNPQHSVARPDVWSYPWIVIQPDSVLKLGRVFYIIPNHVIRDLIKAYKLRNQINSMKYSSQDLRQSPPIESGAKVIPTYRDPGRFYLKRQLSVDARAKLTTTQQSAHRLVKQKSLRKSSSEMNLAQQNSYRCILQKPHVRSRAKITEVAGQDHDQFLEKGLPFESWCEEVLKHETNDRSNKPQISPESRSWVETWLEVTTKQQHCHQEFEGESLDDPWFEVGPIHTSEYANENGEISTKEDRIEFECCSQVHARKSCLRSQSDNGRKLQGHKVTFILPAKEQKKEKILS